MRLKLNNVIDAMFENLEDQIRSNYKGAFEKQLYEELLKGMFHEGILRYDKGERYTVNSVKILFEPEHYNDEDYFTEINLYIRVDDEELTKEMEGYYNDEYFHIGEISDSSYDYLSGLAEANKELFSIFFKGGENIYNREDF